MATNDFLPFGGGGAANVIDQPTYAALAARLTGFQAGTAQSGQLNKVWRQSSIMAAVVAQFIVNQTGQNATDDGTTATLLSNLGTAVAVSARQNPVLADTGTANAYAVANLAAFPAYPTVSGLVIDVSIANANTGASTLNVDGLGAKPIYGLALQPLQGGELIVKGVACFLYVVASTVNSGNGAWILMECAGGAQQIPPATQSQHAVQLGQVSGVVGSVRNLAMSVAAASTSATLTADEIIVESALGGLRYCLANFNKTINLATTGAGGMDTGSAPASGYVALYAIYNPTTQTSALLAKNATSAVQPNVYGGANMPTGYTASALVSVWPTNGSGQLVVGHQIDRTVSLANVQVLSTTTQQPSLTALNISAAIPPNARNASGWVSNIPSSSGTATTNIAGSAAPIGAQQFQGAANASFSFNSTFVRIPTVTSQTIYYSIVVSAGTMSASIYVTSFEF
ncbi:hypothetical protein [Burkholderia vietnamiensis]|uniref:hypothetical protein n=1 Tax=Burkholderia vietnamiensis TaxID=60552 RepID=UPI001D15AC66|nr:hypothetical protein [Burkholderia vietnamiensis]UEC01263.1 hypothetical protein LK462_22135 [Burkholderia vietnamiensis]